METNSQIWRASQVGKKAKDLLALPGFAGRVLAALSNTTYLAGYGGEVLWLASEELPMHRRCILASLHPGPLTEGQDFRVRGAWLQVGNKDLDLNQAKEWEPPTSGPEEAELPAKASLGVKHLFSAIPELGPGEGLGEVIPLIAAMADGEDPPDFLTSHLVAHALPSIFGLTRACILHDMAQIARIGRDLVGLGPGLTPSGDDFLGGLLFAAYSLKTAYPEEFPLMQKPTTHLIKWAQTQTNPISHAILSDLALGQGPAPLHEVVASLLSGKDLACSMKSVSRLLKLGHTSGWDLLAGFLTGMLLLLREKKE